MTLRDRLRQLDPQGRGLPEVPRRANAHGAAAPAADPFALREHWCTPGGAHGDVPLDPARIDAVALSTVGKTPGLNQHPLERWLFLDTETTGLSGGAGTVAFLVGLGRFEDERFVVRQYLMRDFPEEPAMLAGVEAAMQTAEVLVTYNGKTFDIPLLRTRFVMHRRRWPLDGAPHLDLLHTVRRVWRPRLRDASLHTVERGVLGVEREDDLPGALIPEQYFRALREQMPDLLDPILDHNRLDILSLAALAVRVSAVGRDPLHAPAVETEDLVHVGRALEHAGSAAARAQAVACYARAAESPVAETAEDATWRLAMLAKRQADWSEAERLWQVLLTAEWSLAVRALEELAKLHEHRRRDLHAAERWCRQALERLERARRAYGAAETLRAWERRFGHRLARVLRRRAHQFARPA